ncbi:hypothetical protein [Algoriphagus sp. A40]|uniref:hypothetical protein n=1 Tax=Algoriphagus sp. A40 TaxID=1945863 RepID=UPI0009866DFD|nr:hypothetical protein [Algoriphagus sp. A40]OOG74317.1 hypothetical protein B0E43_11975 [Algoriphagus sp. A40]
MKFPSIFRSVTPTRFEIKPRYYDPIKEDIEDRSSRIRKELEEEGQLIKEDNQNRKGIGTGIRGSFSNRGIKPKKTAIASSTGIIRTILFLVMVIGAFGYIYIGPIILNYLLGGILVIGVGYYLIRFLKKGKDD